MALLVIPFGLYLTVLTGAIPLPLESGVMLTLIAGIATLAAIVLRATLPAVAAGVATVGFAGGVLGGSFVVTVASALVIVGGVGFVLSTVNRITNQTGAI